MRIRARIYASASLVAVTALFAQGCASTPPPPRKAADEVEMLKKQGEEIIAQARKLTAKRDERIMVGDRLTIQVWMRDKKTQFSGFPVETEVPRSGKIFIPHTGMLLAAGKMDAEVRDELSRRFAKILRDATVVVEHTQKPLPGGARPAVQAVRHVTVMGWVKRPGIYPIETGVTVRDIIAHAGGLQLFANEKKVYLVRGDADKPEVFKVNMKKVLVGKDLAWNLALEPNDAVYVPPVGMWRTYDIIRVILLPITAVRDAVWVTSSFK